MKQPTIWQSMQYNSFRDRYAIAQVRPPGVYLSSIFSLFKYVNVRTIFGDHRGFVLMFFFGYF